MSKSTKTRPQERQAGPLSKTLRGSLPISLLKAEREGGAPDPTLLDPYDWGPQGVPEGKPLEYLPGQGFVSEF